MSELRPEPPPPRPELLRSLGARLHDVVPGFQPIAQDLLADRSRIDWFGADRDGRGVIALVGEREEDALLLLARLLAQRTWVAARLPDWRKLAPSLPVRPEAGLLGVLLCAGFGSEALAAADALPRDTVRLVRFRCVGNGSGSDVLLEAVPTPGNGDATATASAPAAASTASGGVSGAAPSFRTGLSEDDLGLSDAERAEFD